MLKGIRKLVNVVKAVKGAEKPGHKYIRRTPKGKGYKYQYKEKGKSFLSILKHVKNFSVLPSKAWLKMFNGKFFDSVRYEVEEDYEGGSDDELDDRTMSTIFGQKWEKAQEFIVAAGILHDDVPKGREVTATEYAFALGDYFDNPLRNKVAKRAIECARKQGLVTGTPSSKVYKLYQAHFEKNREWPTYPIER